MMIWALALALAVVMLGTVEAYWRGRGYQPVILDSRQLWSLQRDRVDGSDKVLALLGASRTEYGISLERLRQRLPQYTPVMLSVNGHYPLAALRDLAQDDNFRGIVLCDIDALGFMRASWDRQQSYVDYYHKQWSPSWRIHRIALTAWQRHAVIANPAMGWKESLRYLFIGGKPFKTFAVYQSNRSGDVDFKKGNPEAIKRHFATIVQNRLRAFPDISANSWLANVQPVANWVRAIQSRGGEVIFYQSPTHGMERSAMDQVLPQAQFWDQLPKVIPAHFMDTMQVPAIARIPQPDDSHFDYRDKNAYTDALINELVRRNWLPHAPQDKKSMNSQTAPTASRNPAEVSG